MHFKNDLNQPEGFKPLKIWVDNVNRILQNINKPCLQNNSMKIYSTHNERKSIVPERFIKTLKNNICKYMISVSKNVYFNKLDDIFNECNNTYHRTIKIRPTDVT